MTTKKHLSPDAFIRPAMVELNIDFQDEALFWKFVREKADRIDVLWAEFLEKEALDRLLARKPSLHTLIRHTSLSNRTKNALGRGHLETVGQLAQYSPDEIRRLPGLGKGVLQEITDYMAALEAHLRILE